MSMARRKGAEKPAKKPKAEKAKPIIVCVPNSTLYQANIPDYTGPSHSTTTDPTTDKWLSNQTWPIQGIQQASSSTTASPNTKRKQSGSEDEIGKGWNVVNLPCQCKERGSRRCAERHVKEEVRTSLKEELQTVYGNWKFDQIGNDVVSGSWTEHERLTFENVVKMNPESDGDSGSFMNEALKALPTKNRAQIVSYYMNVYLLNRISGKYRTGCEDFDTDESDGEENGSSAMKYLSGN